ncbi:MAG: acyl-[acyl-carrier-protein] thioesterase [Brotaphodocola sp.]
MYSFKSRVRYSEVDHERKLTMTAIINYMQDCSTFHSEALGVGIDYLAPLHRAWFLSSWQIVIERYPMLGEEITVSTWPYAFKGIYGMRNFTIQDKEGNYLVKANSVWFFFDTEAGKPVRIEEQYADVYRKEEEKKLDMEYAPRKIAVPDTWTAGEPVTVMRHHIDTNHHVNNAQYVEIAREMLPREEKIREVRVDYKKAAVLGDVMFPRISCQDRCDIISLCDEEGNPYAVIWLRTS